MPDARRRDVCFEDLEDASPVAGVQFLQKMNDSFNGGEIVIDVDGRSQDFGGQGLEFPIGTGMVGDGAPGRH